MIIELSNPGADLLDRYRSIVPDWDGFLDALSRPLPLCLWTNSLRTTPAVVRRWLGKEGVKVQSLPWMPAGFKGPPSEKAGQIIPYVAGLYHIQEEVSCLPVILLDPKEGARVIDLCAAPGGKSAQIAVAMRNAGTLISNDFSAVRQRATRGTLDRLGVVNTTITIDDAASLPVDAGPFDCVLADVPCTCEGTSRKNVGAFLNAGPEASRRMAARQLAILRRAIGLCRPGGRVVYATCTYAPEENELVVDTVLREEGDEVELLAASVDGFDSSPGLTSWNGKALDPRLSRSMRVWPHQNDTGGFFVAVMESRGTTAETPAPETEWLPDEKATEWIRLLSDRFGFRRDTFEPYKLLRLSKKYVSIVSRDHRPGRRPVAVSTGMPLIRAQLEYPKLTTAGAMLLGAEVTRNTVDVSEEQAEAYIGRREFQLSDDQGTTITDTGYVLIRRDGVSLGLALCYRDERRVLSMYPKVLSRAVSA